MKFLQRKRRNQRDDQRRPTQTHGSRDRAEWRNRNDAIACLTRTRGLESAQMTRMRGRRGRVTCAICKNTNDAGYEFWAVLTQFQSRKHRLEAAEWTNQVVPTHQLKTC